MKFKLITAFALCTVGLSLKAQTSKITAKATGIKNEKGTCFFCLYNKADGFPAKMSTAISCKSEPIEKGTASHVFENVTDGNYAVGVFHDENKDGKLNTNVLGIPKEGVGVSNNHIPKMSSPSFEASKFVVSAGKETQLLINMKY